MPDATEIQTHSDVIDALGGPASFARAVDVKPSTASEMNRRGNIPPEYWPAAIAEAEKLGLSGITPDSLTMMVARAKGRVPADCTDPIPHTTTTEG